ncbi:MAG: alkaline phosphatase family protein [Alicyclobacillus sp.]|nr:alkaline phosphatase family protein [Alicyclobacillus sp.]
MAQRLWYGIASFILLATGCGFAPESTQPSATKLQTNLAEGRTLNAAPLTRPNAPKHIVIVIEENHAYGEITGNPQAPYINALMKQGATLTNYHAVQHPSEPNYLDLFSGSNQGVTDDSCPHTFSTANLASELMAAHDTFGGYSESMPSVGYTGCTWKWLYVRKHNPWVDFTNVPAADNMPLTSFPKDFAKLPTVSFVVPNVLHDMHSGSIFAADTWLRQHMQSYVQWAKTHDSLLIVTWDEDDNAASNQVPTFFVGPMIRPGKYNEPMNHFNLLRTIEDLYGLKPLGQSRSVSDISGIWRGTQA